MKLLFINQFTNLEELGLEACECTSDPEVKLLTGVYRERLILVGFTKVMHCAFNIGLCDCTEVSAEDLLKTNI